MREKHHKLMLTTRSLSAIWEAIQLLEKDIIECSTQTIEVEVDDPPLEMKQLPPPGRSTYAKVKDPLGNRMIARSLILDSIRQAGTMEYAAVEQIVTDKGYSKNTASARLSELVNKLGLVRKSEVNGRTYYTPV